MFLGMIGLGVVMAPVLWLRGRGPRVGSSCEAGAVDCRDAKTGMVCGPDGKWALSECHGPKGCAKSGTRVRCDFSSAEDGSSCSRAEERQAYCRADKASMSICLSGTIRTVPCRGPFKCADYAKDQPVCDMIVAQRGERCFSEKGGGQFACEVGGKASLKCDGERWVVSRTCKRCSSDGNVVDCD